MRVAQCNCSTDLPAVQGFDLLRATGMLSGSPEVPHGYVEIVQVASA